MPELGHEDRAVGPAAARPRAVFMGDSITEFWKRADPGLFSPEVLNRGVAGETTGQMLARFGPNVTDLRPRAVHILGGTNDLAGAAGPDARARCRDNLAAMAELARGHGVRVILASVPPASPFGWDPQYIPADAVRALNDWLRAHARRNGFAYVDYHARMATPEGGMDPALSDDGVHPNAAGYAVMRPLALAALRQALSASRAPAPRGSG